MAYLPLSTANLPDPVIDPAQDASPEDYFNTVTYSPSTKPFSITDLQFAPDFVWIKRRNGANDHNLFDSVRGATNKLESNNTNAEATGGLTSFNSDGWTDNGDYGDTGASGESYVGWSWKANGSGVSNTDGSITSTVSANTTSGFSICTFTTPSTGTFNFGHGLDSAPDMVIMKSRDSAVFNWIIYHRDLGAGQYLLFTTAAAGSSTALFGNTDPSDTLIYSASDGGGIGTNSDYVSYAFHSVEGFSKFGSYVGNGSTDGPFVYTGFRPAFIMQKNTTVSGTGWHMWDIERGPINPNFLEISANASSAEYSGSGYRDLDFLSNGFKIRVSAANINSSGSTCIYMAFAENPFKYSNAR